MKARDRYLLLALMVAAILAPGALFALGVRGEPIENRPRSPRPTVEPRRLLDTGFYQSIDGYGADALPLRQQLVRWDADIDVVLWHESPNPDVGLGSDDWLFLIDSWRLGCQPESEPEIPIEQFIAVVHVLEASGRNTVLAVAPNKATAYPDRLGALADRARCLDPIRLDARSRLATLGRDYVDLFASVEVAVDRERRRNGPGRSLYYRDDTHWIPELATEAARRLVDHYDSGMWRDEDVMRATTTRVGDLARLVGRPQDEESKSVVVQRPGEGPSQLDDNDRLGPNDWRPGTAEPVLPGRTLVVHDSFLASAEESMAPFFEQSRFVAWQRVDELAVDDGSWLIRELAAADRVVLQLVERRLLGHYAATDANPLPFSAEELVLELREDLTLYRRPDRLAFAAGPSVDADPSRPTRGGVAGRAGVTEPPSASRPGTEPGSASTPGAASSSGTEPESASAYHSIDPARHGATYAIVDGRARRITTRTEVPSGADIEVYDIP